MFSTCIFCHANLGANESIEHFPVGRRLAYDASRGRLWVVCRGCERWNLTPLEERWEAIEECERLFGATRTRVSTDNIGLARLRDGIELVRIGAPQRPEMAAWRYGDQFGRRRRKHLIFTGGALAAAAGLVVLGPVTGIIAGSSWGLYNVFSTANSAYQATRVRAKLVLAGYDEPLRLRLKQLNRVALVQTHTAWALRVPFEVPGPSRTRAFGVVPLPRWANATDRTTLVTGDAALQVAAKLLTAINASGAKREEVRSAVGLIEQTPDAASLFARHAARPVGRQRRESSIEVGGGHAIANLPKEVRLALEMATHEESERRALEGELSLLETAWQEAEEIAAIADDMFIPDDTRRKIAELKHEEQGD